jgi:A/G-specific adenine glycosylase
LAGLLAGATYVPPEVMQTDHARALVAALGRWFRAHRRDFPWRLHDPETGARDPYRVLVSEVMLQQTQASRVVEKYGEFLERFPTIAHLAGSSEDRVLAAWTGLGYYRRARLLHAAAKGVMDRHGGVFPSDFASIRALPGVGAYTAGAVASLAFGQRHPAVDTNVSRVLLRVGGRAMVPGTPGARTLCDNSARALLAESREPGVLNESLIELGATVCVARSPRCGACPVRDWCRAYAKGKTGVIPAKKARAARTRVVHACVVLREGRGGVVLVRRPAKGLWAGLWQVPTVESGVSEAAPSVARVRRVLGLPAGCTLRQAERFTFATTHREVEFVVYATSGRVGPGLLKKLGGKVHDPAMVLAEDTPALSSPQRRILRALLERPASKRYEGLGTS